MLLSAGERAVTAADPIMLEQLFAPTPPDPFNRAASHVDGAVDYAGIAANRAWERQLYG